jgi:hypothetical protein
MSSKKILIVEKTGVIKELAVKVFDETELYKKAGFKSPEGFDQVHQWGFEKGSTTISLYGKTTGRAGQENKYDFPPPVDNQLFFGSCILVSETGSLKKTEWEAYYEELFGGFEDIGAEDSSDESDSDDDEDADLPRTKSGYAKDGFIVDDDEEEDEDDEEEEEEEEEVVVVKSKPKATKKKETKRKQTVFEKIDTDITPPEDNLFLDCSSELTEEEYV